MAQLSFPEAKAFFGEELSDEQTQAILNRAGDMVANMAPPPDPKPANYDARARTAESFLGAWMASGGAVYTSLGGVASDSVSLKNQSAETIVAEHMGHYFVGAHGVGYVWHKEPGE